MNWINSRILGIFRIFLINISVLLALFFTIEVGARFYYSFNSQGGSFFRPPLFISPWFTTLDRPRPIFSAEGNGLSGIFYHRSNAVPMSKSDRTIRIVTIGGSTTANNNAWTDGKIDYSIELERLLQEKYSDYTIEVLNAGGEGFSSAHSLVNFSMRIVEFNPDLILIMHNANDRSVAYFGRDVLPDYANKYMHPTYLAPSVQRLNGIYGSLVQSRVLSHFGIAKLFATRELRDPSQINPESLLFLENVFRRNLVIIASAAHSLGINVLFLTQPYDPVRMASKYHSHHEDFNDIVEQAAHEVGVTFFDQAEAFGSEASLFVDPIHYSVEGVRKFAKLLVPVVSAILTERITRPGYPR